jgi:ABC-type branched-subunit amino acid transport system substrate-binding protein
MDKSVEGKSDYFYTLGHTVDSQRDTVRKFFAANATAKTATILCWNDAWGLAHAQLFKEVMAERGIKLLGEECTNDFGTSFRTELTKLQALKPDVLLATPSTIAFYKTRHDLGITTPMLTTNIVIDGLENQNMPRELAQGVYFMEWMPSKAFADAFKKAYGKVPIMEAQNHYEAVRALAKAMEKNPNDVLAGLRTVKYEGIAGLIDFTGDHTQVNQEKAKLYLVGDTGYVEVK